MSVTNLCDAIARAYGVGCSPTVGLEKFASVDEAFPTLEFLTGNVDATGAAVRTRVPPITPQQAKDALAAYRPPPAARDLAAEIDAMDARLAALEGAR